MKCLGVKRRWYRMKEDEEHARMEVRARWKVKLISHELSEVFRDEEDVTENEGIRGTSEGRNRQTVEMEAKSRVGVGVIEEVDKEKTDEKKER
jgi:hypothetical protein